MTTPTTPPLEPQQLKHYVEAAPASIGYRGRVYKYDATGNLETTVFLSPKTRDSKESAIDDATDWCDGKGLEYEIMF